MSLEGLFTDRKVRKLIRESVYNAQESINSVCDCCGREGNTLKIDKYNLCESCSDKLNNISEDYDRAYDSDYLDLDKVITEELISEAFVKIGNFKKFVDTVNTTYGGDTAKLFKDYNLTKPWNCGVIISKQKTEIEIPPEDIKDSKTKINRFIDDFDVQLSTRALNTLAPDADGYVARCKGGNGTATSVNTQSAPKPSNPAPVTKAQTQTSDKKEVARGTGFTAEGDENQFKIKIADDISLVCVKSQTQATAGSSLYGVKVEGVSGDAVDYLVKTADIKKMAGDILDEIKKTPCNVFQSFDDDFDSSKGYVLNDYPNYSFLFDDKSFDGRTLTLVLALNGKPYEHTRIALSQRDIISKAALDGRLLKALNSRLSKWYPSLYNGTLELRTSIGKTFSELVQVDNNNVVKVRTEIGNIGFEWEIKGDTLKDKELSINSMLDAVYANMNKIIPDWSSNAIRDKKTPKGYTDSFVYETTSDPKVSIFLHFSMNEFYETKGINFHMSVLDKTTGIEQPKEFVSFTYNRPGTKIEDFAKANGERIYKKYFSKTDMESTLTVSAQAKLANRSKREVFLSYVADRIKKAIPKERIMDLDLDIEEFDVNPDHKVTNVVFRVSDPFNEVAGTSDDLKKELNLETISWVKFVKADSTPRSMKENGPSVVYKVDKIKDFSEAIELAVLESAMLEAFGLIDRSKRKIIGVNEAYWKEVDGEYTLVI